MPVDMALGANYGFLGNPADPSEVPPFVDALGPWPQRAIIVIAMAPLGFAVVLLPWLIARPAGAPANRRNQAMRVELSRYHQNNAKET